MALEDVLAAIDVMKNVEDPMDEDNSFVVASSPTTPANDNRTAGSANPSTPEVACSPDDGMDYHCFVCYGGSF